MMLFDKVLFIILVIFFAYSLKKINIFKENDVIIFINFVIYFALPLSILKNLRFININKDVLILPLIAWISILISIFIAYIVGKLLKLKIETLKSFILISSFGNTAFMGYPFVFALEGKEALTYAIIYDQLGSFLLVITLGLLIAVGRIAIKELLTFPPFIALILSFLFHNVHFPSFLEYFLEIVSSSLIPVILFSLGLRLEFKDFNYDKKVLFLALFIKMIVVPSMLLFLLKSMGLNSLPYKVALLETAMPPMVFAGVLTLKYQLDYKLAFSAITLGIVISLFTVPLFGNLL
ncbi:MAG TPA: AEC family transporter [Aquifex aeolicus]|nr:AEC family transporter [Aquifex aeolicus]